MKKINQFCLYILRSPVERHSRALANVVMALSSYASSSVTGLSKSPLFFYQYSSISDAIKHFAYDEIYREQVERWFVRLFLMKYWSSDGHFVLQTDTTSVRKPHSPTLMERILVYIPNNKIACNKPLDIGYEYSFVNLSWGKYPRWSLPLKINRVQPNESNQEVAAQQVRSLLQDGSLPFKGQEFVVNTLDRGYLAHYLRAVKGINNLVSVLALRHGSKIYAPADQGSKDKKVFGQKYYLVEKTATKTYKKHPKTKLPYTVHLNSVLDRTPDESGEHTETLYNGRNVLVQVKRFNNLIWRTKKGVRMHDQAADIVFANVLDAQTLSPVFQRPLFVAAVGPQKHQLSARQIYQDYQKRSAIEPFFRFSKQKLFLQNFQSNTLQHLNNWTNIIMITVWLLFSLKDSKGSNPEKWQKYNERKAQKSQPQQPIALSLAQTRKIAQDSLLTFDKTPFFPIKSKPGPGRKEGQTQKKRQTYKYIKKNTKKSANNSS